MGEVTFRRVHTNKEAFPSSDKRILCNGAMVPIEWDKVKISLLKEGTYKKVKNRRTPTMAVTHWDVCLSADSCKRVLERGISTHFVIDNDGNNSTAGLTAMTSRGMPVLERLIIVSIGIDFSNAYYTKYQSNYIKNGHGPRPVLGRQQGPWSKA